MMDGDLTELLDALAAEHQAELLATLSGEAEVANVTACIDTATKQIAGALGLEKREARLEAQILASCALQVNRAWLIAHDQDVLTPTQADAVEALIARREQGEPVAYILGEKEFYGRLFRSPGRAHSRPETELLVEAALNGCPKTARHRC